MQLYFVEVALIMQACCFAAVVSENCADTSSGSCMKGPNEDANSMMQQKIMVDMGDSLKTPSHALCDPNCKDTIADCLTADNTWNMCSSGNTWWMNGCKATCGSCNACGRSKRCCRDKKDSATCAQAQRVWNMCTANAWWRKQCKKTCNACGSLPSCSGTATPSPPAPPPATAAPTPAPTLAPTLAPTQAPTPATTAAPTQAPTQAPTPATTAAPTQAPTQAPTPAATAAPTPPPTPATAGPAPSGNWQTGKATFYGNAGSGGHCGGTELWPKGYGTGSGWIDGLYVATASNMWCGQGTACGNKHSPDCGHCYEVLCTGTHVNTNGYVPCTGKSVTVAVTDECPGGSANPTHCTGAVNHFDLSTKAFQVIGDTRAGVLDIKWRQVACPVPMSTNLKLVILGHQWWFKIAAKDAAGPGALAKIEVKAAALKGWLALGPDYGAFFKYSGNIGTGPFEFRLTADDGQTLSYKMQSATFKAGTFDIGSNFVAR